MRNWIDITTRRFVPQVPFLSSSLLLEFAGDNSRQLDSTVQVLQQHFSAPLQRVGGPKRIYDIEESGQRGAVYVIGNTVRAIGLGWKDIAAGVCSVYVWNALNLFKQPDFEIVLPVVGNFDKMAERIVGLLHSQIEGEVEIDFTAPKAPAIKPPAFATNRTPVLAEARRSTDAEFISMVQQMYGQKAKSLTWPEIIAVAETNKVQVPGGIRHNRNLKTDAHHWNLSGSDAPDVVPGLEKGLGAPVEAPDAVAAPDFQPLVQLSKAKEIKRLVGAGKIYIMGRKPNGAFFRVPGAEEYSAQMERLLARDLESGTGKQTMEEQYELLADRVALVASGKSQYIKALLITGAPSSGKSYNVMQTIKKTLNMEAGTDYIVKKGVVTRPALYRILIEQINGMVIFDDCDGVVDDKNAINMLKGALDTDPIREISYDVRGTINIAVLPEEQRTEYCMRLSRVLRAIPDPSDADYFAPYAKIKGKKAAPTAPPEDDDGGFDSEYEEEPDESMDAAIFDYVTQHLPNKVDFQGRIIFISNLEVDEWDSAITSRAVTINLSFSDLEMLDYIEKIKGSFESSLDDEQKSDVMIYLRELWTLGKINRSINFRLVQMCFDYRLMPSWKKLMALL